MQRLTKEQAAIIGAYTGYACGPFSDVQDYAEKVLGYETLDITFKSEAIKDKLRKKSREDFLNLCFQDVEKFTFKFDVAMDVRAYGTLEIEATDIEDAKAKIRKMNDADIFNNYHPHGNGSDDFSMIDEDNMNVYVDSWRSDDTGDEGDISEMKEDL